jgi:hypothetical protein
MNVSVFGGSQCKPGDEAYQEAEYLGKLLALSGITVLTGGYIGVMEAVSRGAANVGGQVVGVTCDEIEAWRPVGPNAWITEERRFPTLRQRLFALIDGCDAAIAMPGGIGTLAEMAEMWSQIQCRAITPRPIILVGRGWLDTISIFYSSFDPYIPNQYRRLLTFAENVEAAIAYLNEYLKDTVT